MHESDTEAALVRPFLSRSEGDTPRAEESSDETEAAMVRSYAMTSGRARGTIELEIEAMLQVTPGGLVEAGSLKFERAAIVHLCRSEILSVAELSARLKLPIGVIRVVASDLIEEGVLEAFLPSFTVAEDVDLITRLIEGVRAL
jgi:Protein of unknown function (DUF742)